MWVFNTKLRKSSSGFTVVELLITLGIILSVFGAFIIAFTTIQSINKKALDIISANTAAFSKIEEYENKNYTSLPSTLPVGTLQEVEDFSSSLPTTLKNPRVGKVYINSTSSTLKHVVVTVNYGSGADLRTLQYSSFIQRNGVGR